MTTISVNRRSRNAARVMQQEDMKVILLNLIETTPRTASELCKMLGVTDSTIRRRLLDLEAAGLVRRVERRHAQYFNAYWLWNFGPGTTPAPLDRKMLKDVEAPNRKFTRNYPAVDRRDPLVSALFGFAGSVA